MAYLVRGATALDLNYGVIGKRLFGYRTLGGNLEEGSLWGLTAGQTGCYRVPPREIILLFK